MEITQYIKILRRWWWLLFLAGLIAGAYTFITAIRQPERYRAQVTLTIGNAIESPNPDWSQVSIGQDLVFTYNRLIRTYEVLDGTVETLNLPFEPESLHGMISTNIVSYTSLIEVSVTYTDPILAADIANELANQLILQSPSNLTPELQAQVTLLNDQINEQSQELIVLRDQLRLVNNTLSSNQNLSTERQEELVTERTELVSQINTASSNIAQFTNTVASVQQRANSIEVVEAARVPSAPIGQSVINEVLLAIMIAVTLVFGCVLAYEYLNDTFRNADEVAHALKLPVIGVISKFGNRDAAYNEQITANMPPTSQILEEYNTLRSNLMFSAQGNPRIIGVTSSSPSEGKTVTSANIAISIAKSGKRVLLIDADMRRPKSHLAFELDNEMGLSNLLTPSRNLDDDTDPTREEAKKTKYFDSDTWRKLVKTTGIENLYMITSGYLPENPSALIGSPLMVRWVEQIKKTNFFDVIIFDTPPVLAVADATVLAGSIDIDILLVVRAGITRKGAAQKSKERFEALDIPLTGIILNGANLRDESYYGYDYSYYYRTPETQ